MKFKTKILKEPLILKVVLGVFLTVGIAGFTVEETRDLFRNLTPVAIILSLLVLLPYHEPEFNQKSILVFGSIVILSWMVEAAGVAGGTIFGTYSYGNGLGIKILDTPLLIGVNWFLLIYTTSCMVNKLPVSTPLKVFFASLMMVLYDFIMEQTAPELDMWSFEEGMPGSRNYIAWFIISALFHYSLRIAGVQFSNRMASFVFIMQTLFFIALITTFRVMQ